ncbi:MAG: hypothetical protein A2V93_09610 [Ignavibacteria bacterium RBG_16_34_14]|nr:MAG: hypothetical protein A2V93_09610 [Ignavibacteria bacterium RBG_16_34_14]
MQKSALLIFLILSSFYTYAIIPPKPGMKPPQSFIDFHRMVQGQYSKGYYAQLFRERKELREQISNGFIRDKILEEDTVFALTLMGQYTNLSATYTQQALQERLFDGPNPTGTITDFYSEISYNQLRFTGTCSGWYNMPRTLEQYVGNNNGLGTQGGPRFVLDIVMIADSTLNFADYIQYYDAQNKPHIGFLAVVHAGAGAEQGANNIWSHRWNFRVITGGQTFTTNDIDPVSGQNVIIDGDYAIQPEMDGGSNSNGPLINIGVFAHEFGHIFGLPDLYDTDNSSEGLGNWCLMAGGSYGGDGNSSHTPVHMSAWCKKELGWVNVINVTNAIDSLVVQNVEENPVIYRMWKNGTIGLQYFLIENRQKIHFDANLYSPGFLIFHVDDAMNGNQNENHYLVDLEQADGYRNLNNGSGRGDTGDPFPGSTNNTRFDINTNPNSKDYSLQNTFVSLRNIRQDGLNMIADLDIGTRPYLELNSVTISEHNIQNGRVEPNETGDVNFVLNNISPANSLNTTVRYFLTVNEITVINSEYSEPINGEATQTLTIDSAFSVSANFNPNTLSLRYEIISEGNTIEDTVDVVIGIPKTLLISKSEQKSYDSYYISSFNELGKNYEESYNNIPEFISRRDAVIIFTSKAFENIFTQAEIDSFSSFIANGGKIMFTGQALADNLQNEYPDFLHNDIGIGWESNMFLPNYSYGIPGDLFGDQFSSLRIRGIGGANNQVNPDVLTILDSSFHFSLTYQSSGTKPAGGWIEKPDGAKIIFWGFGFEGIDDSQSSVTRTQVLNTIFQWFDGTLDVPGENPFSTIDYELSQNYPNPFNPITTISYHVPVKSFVSLKVYDILGREIQTLVNEEKNAGKYEIRFDASLLTSGVYFYKIRSEKYSDVKKMLLVK